MKQVLHDHSDSKLLSRYDSLKSPYLEAGYKDDVLDVVNFSYQDGILDTQLGVRQYYPDLQGEFHLSATTALVWVQQLAVFFMHIHLGKREKDKEVYVSRCKVKFSRVISDSDIRIKTEVKSHKTRSGMHFFEIECKINDGAFIAIANCCVAEDDLAKPIGNQETENLSV